LPYGPGWIGCLGYGLRQAFENVPQRHADETGIADVELAYYPAVALYDNREKCWWLRWRQGADEQVRSLRAMLAGDGQPIGPIATQPLRPRIDRATYLSAVRRAIEYIHAGDVFQVNYAHEFSAPFEGDPIALYQALRTSNPAPYCAFVDLGGGRAVLSTSPELFVSQRGSTLETRPIKGTRPRGANADEDRRLISELESSEKDAAELAMIVDLERNDLGRVCDPGSVRVDEPGRIESFASVHHRVAKVSGQLEDGFDRVDVLAAAFPGGSITGAPKVRAMEIIDELEDSRRGPYTGSIGILTDEGSMEFNIAIRTAVVGRGIVRVHVGGGIVADSDPEAEYEETLAKGRAIFSALES
jgi:para-aminobenzoate synthetase component 1